MKVLNGVGAGSMVVFIIQLVCILTGFYELLFSKAYFSPYFVILISAVVCLFLNYGSKAILSRLVKSIIVIFSLLFALMITLANYDLWEVSGPVGAFLFIALLLGTWSAWFNILLWISSHTDRIAWKKSENAWKPLYVFIATFIFIAGINLIVLFQCKYPGNLTPDSTDQVNQQIVNIYSNHHPFWHTMTIKIFFTIGYILFHDINAAVATYSTFSIIAMAASFAFAVATVSELRSPRWLIVLLSAFFALMPYHIFYSMTVWKDSFYAASVLLFSVFLFRCIEKMSMVRLNYIGLILSGLGVCLYRSNGFFVFVFTTVIFLALMYGHKKIFFIMLSIVVISFIMKHPVLKALNVSQTDTIESLSIPAQQIARDVIENDDFTEDEKALLNEVVDMDRIPETYKWFISDPIKNLVRERGNQRFLKQHAWEFAFFYISRFLKHPFTYIKAWVDQTKGYWNAGYDYWPWADYVNENSMGIYRMTVNDWLNNKVNGYSYRFINMPVLHIFLSIGFFDWLVFISLFVSIIRRDKIGAMLSVPLFMNIVSLVIATPVYSEMRYNYAVFCAVPVVIGLVLRPNIINTSREEKFKGMQGRERQ